jgi:hypothetical protein
MGVLAHRTFGRRSGVAQRTIDLSGAPDSCSDFDEMHRLRGRIEVVVSDFVGFEGVRKY